MINRDYVVVTPVRNEEKYLGLLIDSMVAQTVQPVCWVIVNDGSTDQTGQIAEVAAQAHSWIKVVNRADRGFRKAGGGVVDSFYEGWRLVENLRRDYVVKLDGDLSFAPDYFERCFQAFEEDAKLGVAGGTICCMKGGRLEAEYKKDPRFHVRGAVKIYKEACWEAIGGLIPAPGWDTLDEVKANMLGWTSRTLEIDVHHHRPTGAAYGTWADQVKGGLANYISGYHPLFFLLKCGQRMFRPPYLIGGLGLMYGYTKGFIQHVPQVDDKDLIKYFQAQQINRLLGRKNLWS
jgi:biofilm PGA synthesis N-glycosyltransferase PgaC